MAKPSGEIFQMWTTTMIDRRKRSVERTIRAIEHDNPNGRRGPFPRHFMMPNDSIELRNVRNLAHEYGLASEKLERNRVLWLISNERLQALNRMAFTWADAMSNAGIGFEAFKRLVATEEALHSIVL